MKTSLLLLSAALALAAVAPAGQAYTGPHRDLNPCERPGSDIGADAAVGHACVGTRATWCTAWIEWTAIPALDTCLVAPPQPPLAGASVQCMDVYSRHDVGNYAIVRRDSCAPPEVYECPYPRAPIQECEHLLTASSASASGPDCYDITTAGTPAP